MKIALCFIISYDHILNKEKQWIRWIEPNKDLINVYFHYGEYKKIKSQWIRDRAIPIEYIARTSYFHVVPAYMSLLNYAAFHDKQNQWFCLLTDSCVPIVSPLKFREMFLTYYKYSIFKWSPAWWDLNHHKRANLHRLHEDYHLANDPWFVVTRPDVRRFLKYAHVNKVIYNIICKGGLANESIFAIILQSFGKLTESGTHIINSSSHVVDWSRMSSSTSPYLFINGNSLETKFIRSYLKENKYAMFLRKVHAEFPDNVLQSLMMEQDIEPDDIIMARCNWLHWKMFFATWYTRIFNLECLIMLGLGFISCVTTYFVCIGLTKTKN